MRIKILSDSTCDLPKDYLAQHDVTLVPLTVIKNDVAFKDGVDIHPADIFAHVAAGGALCSTSAGCTVSCHCGPGTLGILFMKK